MNARDRVVDPDAAHPPHCTEPGHIPGCPGAAGGDHELCDHPAVEPDDDGQGGRWFVCSVCDSIVVPSEPDEDGHSTWEKIDA